MIGVDGPILLELDPGDEQEPEQCPGPIAPIDQTVICDLCGLAWWSDESELFEAVHGPIDTWKLRDEATT